MEKLLGDCAAIMSNVDKTDPVAPIGIAIYRGTDELMAYVHMDLMTAAAFAEKFCMKLLEAAKAAEEERKTEH